MPFNRPSLTDQRNQVAADIAAALPGADPTLRFSPLRILGDAMAGLSHGHYGYIDYIAQQAVPYTATGEFLEAWGALKNVFRKGPAIATGSATFLGSDGSVIPGGTLLRTPSGLEFITASDGTVAAGSATVAVEAAEAGSRFNLTAGASLLLSTAIPGLQPTGVAATFTGGADVEDDERFRARVMLEFQRPPHGGSGGDYVQWALAVPGVTRAWCVPHGFGAGTVVVYVMLDLVRVANAGFPIGSNGKSAYETRSGTLATGDQLLVANAIHPSQPVTALVYVCSPIALWVPFTITGLTAASAATRTQIAAAIDDVFRRTGTAAGGKVNLSDIESEIAAITGTAGFVITSPAGNIALPVGSLPVRGAITYA